MLLLFRPQIIGRFFRPMLRSASRSGNWFRSSRSLTRKKGTSEATNAVQEYRPVRTKSVPMTMKVPNPNPGAMRHSSGRRVIQFV